MESLDLFLAKLSLRRSLCSFNLVARSFWYSAASDLALAILFFLSEILARFLCKVKGVTNLWILGALLTFFPATNRNHKTLITLTCLRQTSPKKLLALLLIFYKKIKHAFIRMASHTSFGCEWSPVSIDILANIILLWEIKKLADLWCSLWTSHPWFLCVSESRKIILTLLHNYQVQNRKVLTDNTPAHRLPPAFSIAPSISTEAGGSYGGKTEMQLNISQANRSTL